MNTSENQIAVEDRIDIRVDGKTHTILMTYGLLTRLTRTVNGSEEVADAGFSADSRDAVITECFRKKGKNGFMEIPPGEQLDMDELDISVDDVDLLMAWATAHLSNFFIKRLKAAEKGMEVMAKAMEGLNAGVSAPSAPGLMDSTSLTPSAGPSA